MSNIITYNNILYVTPDTISESIACGLYIDHTQVNILCNGSATGSITLSISNGVAPYTFFWGAGHPVTQNRVNLLAGTYNVTVTDVNGKTGSKTIVITQPQPVILTTTQTNVLVNGEETGTIDLTQIGGTPPFTQIWKKNISSYGGWDNAPVYSTVQDPTGLGVGTYTSRSTDANGCTSDISATITQPTAVVISYTQTNVLCNGAATGSIDLTVSGGISPYTYNWGAGQPTTQDRSGLTAGVYTVTVKDANNATHIRTITIIEESLMIINESHVDILCNGVSSGSIDITVSGGTSPYTYNWGSGITTQDRTGLPAGTYNVTVTDALGCVKTKSITLTQPTPLLLSTGQVNPLVNGAATGSIDLSYMGGTEPMTYLWSNGATTQDLTGLTAGTYSVVVTDANGCSKSISATLTQPSALNVSQNLTNVKCFGGSTGAIDISVTGGVPFAGGLYHYLWENGATTQDRTGLIAGNYSVTITDANGATAIRNYTITELTEIVITSSKTDVSCFGYANGSIDVSVSGGTGSYAYNWSNGATSQDITNLSAGTYTLTVTDGNLCTKTHVVTITQPVMSSISGFTWIDTNQDGLFNNGESMLDGVQVRLYNANPDGSPNGSALGSIFTAGGGLYTFNNVCAGNYTVHFDIVGGYTRTVKLNSVSKDLLDSDADATTGYTDLIVMTAGETDITVNAGYYL